MNQGYTSVQSQQYPSLTAGGRTPASAAAEGHNLSVEARLFVQKELAKQKYTDTSPENLQQSMPQEQQPQTAVMRFSTTPAAADTAHATDADPTKQRKCSSCGKMKLLMEFSGKCTCDKCRTRKRVKSALKICESRETLEGLHFENQWLKDQLNLLAKNLTATALEVAQLTELLLIKHTSDFSEDDARSSRTKRSIEEVSDTTSKKQKPNGFLEYQARDTLSSENNGEEVENHSGRGNSSSEEVLGQLLQDLKKMTKVDRNDNPTAVRLLLAISEQALENSKM